MKKYFYPKTFLLSLFISVFFQLNSYAQLLTVSGQKIVNSSTNQEVILNAINFGNWMVMEGYMMSSTSQAPDQHTWKKKLNTLIGTQKTNEFYDAWLANHVTAADINQIKAWGFNSVRIPLHYEYFVNLGTPDVWNDKGFTLLDNVLSWCRSAGIYAIIDLHAAPGGQSNNNISDYDNTKPALWESNANKSKTVKLWRKLSERYKNETIVAGYDLINEPAWDLTGGVALRQLYGRLTDTIRTNGDNHILFIEGNWYSNDYTGLTPAWDANMVYVFHKYWSTNSSADIKFALDMRTTQNRPIWCGEHGENSNTHFTKTAELLKAYNIGTSWWPMKKFESINDFADAKYPSGYQDLLNYFAGTNPNLDPTTAFNILMQLAENVKLQNCKENTEVLRAVFKQPQNRNTEAWTLNQIPGRIYAPEYDMGLEGFAYSDQASEDLHVTTSKYTAWNDGWIYRNNGVDIETCTDQLSNGYSIGWFYQFEWMKYTVNIQKKGTYTVEFRVANGSGTTGTLQIQNAQGTEVLATATIPNTGSYKTWATVSCTGNFNASGTQAIRIANAAGNYNVASVNFVFSDTTSSVANNPVPIYTHTVTLKGNNNLYVSGSGTGSLMVCTKTSVGTTEQFTLVDAENGQYALKAGNGKYVTLNTSDSKLYCNGTTIGETQKFTLTNLYGVYSIKGSNGLFVSSENGATSGMTCTRTSPAGWEFFNWAIVSSTYTIPVSYIFLNRNEANVEIGKTIQLYPTVFPENAANKAVTYTSSSKAVATVSSTGLITGVSAGTTTITVTSADGKKTATCKVSINLTDIPEISPLASIKLFPNPAQNKLIVSSLLEKEATLAIYDLRGKLLITNSLINSEQTIDISELANGMYVAKITESDNVKVIRFIKNN